MISRELALRMIIVPLSLVGLQFWIVSSGLLRLRSFSILCWEHGGQFDVSLLLITNINSIRQKFVLLPPFRSAFSGLCDNLDRLITWCNATICCYFEISVCQNLWQSGFYRKTVFFPNSCNICWSIAVTLVWKSSVKLVDFPLPVCVFARFEMKP